MSESADTLEGTGGESRHLVWRVLDGIAWAVAGVLVLLLAVPFRPDFVSSSDLDPSWRYVLSWAYVKGLAFGREIVFTYGPWGFAASDQYYPGTLAAHVAVRGLVAGALVAAWAVLCKRTGFSAVLGAGVIVVVAGVATMSYTDPFFYALPVVAGLLYVVGGQPWKWKWGGDTVLAGFTFVLALAGLMKFSTMVHLAGVVGLCVLADVLRRRVPWVGIAFVAGVVVWWLAAGQGLGDLAAFLANAWEMVRGYDETMGVVSGDWVAYPVFFVGAWLVVWPAWRVLGEKGAGLLRWVFLGVMMWTLLLAFKAAFVRHDGEHEGNATRMLVVLSLLVLPVVFWGGRLLPWRTKGLAWGGALAAVGVGLFAVHLTYLRLPLMPDQRSAWGEAANLGTVAAGRARFVGELLRDKGAAEKAYAKARAEIAADNVMPPGISGTADLYSVNQAGMVVGDIAYQPRPLVQSYAAYTGKLQALNAAHLRGPRAPGTVLVQNVSIIGLYPSMEDALSWPELLTRYEPVGFFGRGDPLDVRPDVSRRRSPMLVLNKGPGAREWSLEKLGSATAKFGEAVTVPSAREGPVWVRMKMRKTVLGKVLGMAFRSPSVLMGFEIDGGGGGTARIVPSVAEAGFLLSPFVPDTAGWLELFRDRSERVDPGRGVLKSIVVALQPGESARMWYGETVEIEFFRLKYMTRPTAALAMGNLGTKGNGEWGNAELLMGELSDGTGRASAVLGRVEGVGTVVYAPPPRAMRLKIPTGLGTGARELTVTYGIRADSPSKDNVAFRVALLTGQQATRLWEVVVDPEKTKGPATVTVRIPEGFAGEVLLQTVSPDPARPPLSYWARPSWR